MSKSTWNHRILAHPDGDEVFLQIHEVYYDENHKPNGYTKNAARVCGSSGRDLAWTLDKMKECLKKPVLWAGERFPEEYKF